VRQPHTTGTRYRSDPHHQRSRTREAWIGPNGDDASGLAALKARGLVGHPLGKNSGEVWRLSSSNYRGGHHATFPVALAARAISAVCPEARCTACRLPRKRAVIRMLGGVATRAVLAAGCTCDAPTEPGLVVEPFFGASSTGVTAERLQRDWLGIELNPTFASLARQRIENASASPQRPTA